MIVLAHGGRGWWYDQAAFLALMKPNVWLEVSGLPPQRVADYYGSSLPRLADKMIFGNPTGQAAPGVEHNARTLEKTLLDAGLHGRPGDRGPGRQCRKSKGRRFESRLTT